MQKQIDVIIKGLEQLTVAVRELQASVDASGRSYWEECPEMIIGRDDAKRLALPRYRTGRACSRGHSGWRYTSTGACTECANRTADGRTNYQVTMRNLALKAADTCRKLGIAMAAVDAKWLEPEDLEGIEIKGKTDNYNKDKIH